MATKPATFWSAPGQYMRWASRAKPAIFHSIWIGALGPLMMIVVPPLRARFGDGPRQQIPLTYPIPKGPRKIPEGYDD